MMMALPPSPVTFHLFPVHLLPTDAQVNLASTRLCGGPSQTRCGHGIRVAAVSHSFSVGKTFKCQQHLSETSADSIILWLKLPPPHP